MNLEDLHKHLKSAPIPEVKIGVFGESGTGKTTLLTAYYGNLRKDQWLKAHKYSILADDREQGRLLYDRYEGLAKDHIFPDGTSMFSEYSFQLQLQNPQSPSERLTPPPLRIRWYDYPGKWWTQQTSDTGEYASRKNAINKLLTSNVGMLVFDGAKFRKDGSSYLRAALVSFTDEVRRHKLDLQTYVVSPDNKSKMEYPKHWMLCLSKSDLFEANFSAKEFRELLTDNAGSQLDELGSEIGKKKPYRWSYLLLSSAQGGGGRVFSADKPRGLELIAPIALLAPLEQIGNVSIPKRFASRAMKSTAWTIDKTRDILTWVAGSEASSNDPKVGYRASQFFTADGMFAILFAVALSKILEKGSSYLTRRLEKAAKKGLILDAAICAMQLEMSTDKAKHLYYDDHLEQLKHKKKQESILGKSRRALLKWWPKSETLREESQ